VLQHESDDDLLGLFHKLVIEESMPLRRVIAYIANLPLCGPLYEMVATPRLSCHAVDKGILEDGFSRFTSQERAPSIPVLLIVLEKRLLIEYFGIFFLFESHALDKVLDNVHVTKRKHLGEADIHGNNTNVESTLAGSKQGATFELLKLVRILSKRRRQETESLEKSLSIRVIKVMYKTKALCIPS
jgi:hypothetical protein